MKLDTVMVMDMGMRMIMGRDMGRSMGRKNRKQIKTSVMKVMIIHIYLNTIKMRRATMIKTNWRLLMTRFKKVK